MINTTDAIFLDVGNTLRILTQDPPYQAAARQRIIDLVGAPDRPEDLDVELNKRYKAYRKWAFETLIEASEPELWTRWLLPEYPAEKIAGLAHELTYQFRQSMGRRVLAADGRDVVIELHRRGYVLGIISNVITTEEIPDWLAADGLDIYFKSVVLSSVMGRRKPDPALFHEAARRAGVELSRCVYVGDNASRDVVGSRRAGFGGVILLPDRADRDKPIPAEFQPDRVIHSLSELLTHFPPRAVGHGLKQ
jgi:HAD superfamily hydrolase (TIGR01662 family)